MSLTRKTGNVILILAAVLLTVSIVGIMEYWHSFGNRISSNYYTGLAPNSKDDGTVSFSGFKHLKLENWEACRIQVSTDAGHGVILLPDDYEGWSQHLQGDTLTVIKTGNDPIGDPWIEIPPNFNLASISLVNVNEAQFEDQSYLHEFEINCINSQLELLCQFQNLTIIGQNANVDCFKNISNLKVLLDHSEIDLYRSTKLSGTITNGSYLSGDVYEVNLNDLDNHSYTDLNFMKGKIQHRNKTLTSYKLNFERP